MIFLFRAATILALLAILSACSWIGTDEAEYVSSTEHPPLQIPAGLDRPEGSSPITIALPDMRKPAGDELEPPPPRVASTAGMQDADAYLAWSANGVYLFVRDTPDSVARRLGYAIVNSGMTMLQRSDVGSHRFHYKQDVSDDQGFFSNMAFWRDTRLDFSGTFMTSVKADGENTRVYLLFGTGESVDTAGAEHVLGIFMDRLG
jgi:uncharacterized lipoprotein